MDEQAKPQAKPQAKSHSAQAQRPTVSKTVLAGLRKELEAERLQLIAQIERLDAEFRDESYKEPRSDDDAESGSATSEREHTMSLARNARELLSQIDKSLARMDKGTYGLCVSCGKPIPKERLEALPHASHCLECRRRVERSGR